MAEAVRAFLTPLFGFNLFYLKGGAPPEVQTMEINYGVMPFIILQMIVPGILLQFPEWFGFSMLRGTTAGSGDTSSSLTPLLLFAASPGTITGVITLSVVHSRSELPVTALIAVAAATLVTWLVLVLLSRGGGKAAGGGFVRSTVQSFMGLIVMAMGVQFGLKGLSAFIQGVGG